MLQYFQLKNFRHNWLQCQTCDLGLNRRQVALYFDHWSILTPILPTPMVTATVRKSVVNVSSRSKGGMMRSEMVTIPSRMPFLFPTRSQARFLYWTMPLSHQVLGDVPTGNSSACHWPCNLLWWHFYALGHVSLTQWWATTIVIRVTSADASTLWLQHPASVSLTPAPSHTAAIRFVRNTLLLRLRGLSWCAFVIVLIFYIICIIRLVISPYWTNLGSCHYLNI